MLVALDTIAPARRPGLRVSAEPVQPREAIDWFGKKTPLDKAGWETLSEDARKRAFTAAWVTDVNVLQSVKDSLRQAIDSGESFESWKKRIRADLGDRWSRSDAYLETVFRNNVQSAYAAGRYKAQTTPLILRMRPFWRLVVLLDGRTSDICTALAKPPVVLPAEHPWWATHWPPLHHRCRTTVVSMSRRQAERLGILKGAPRVDAQEGWGSTAGLGEWQPTGEGLDPALFKPAEKAAAKALPKAEPAVEPPKKVVPQVTTEPEKRADEAPKAKPSESAAKPDTVPAWTKATAGKRRFPVGREIARGSKKVFGGEAPSFDALEKAWSGAGVDAAITGVSWDDALQTLQVDARLATGGKAVGRMTRSFRRKDGQIVAIHDYLVLDDAVQGRGYGAAALRESIRLYRSIGADAIELDAHWVGRYTWARFGFNWSEATAIVVRVKLVEFLKERGVPADDATALAAATHRSAAAVADLEYDGRRLGKEFLLSGALSNWRGSMRLDEDDAGYQRAKERLDL